MFERSKTQEVRSDKVYVDAIEVSDCEDNPECKEIVDSARVLTSGMARMSWDSGLGDGHNWIVRGQVGGRDTRGKFCRKLEGGQC